MESDKLAKGNPFLPPCQWNLIQYGFLCAYTMGWNAIWKFPHHVYKHTGLFLVAYYIVLLLVGVPVTFIQLKVGSVYRRGIFAIFAHYTPALKGVAVAVLAISFIMCTYNNVYLSYAVYYMCTSMKQPFGWSDFRNASERADSTIVFFGRTPEEEYYYNDFLMRSGSLSTPGGVPWHLGLCLFVVWVAVFFAICRGSSGFGKVLYVTSPLALLSLCALVIYSHTVIPTAQQALPHFFSEHKSPVATNGHAVAAPRDHNVLQSELSSPLTWLHALEQHIYGIGLWAGILPTIGNRLSSKKPVANLTWLILVMVHSLLPHMATIAMAPLLHALSVAKHRPLTKIVDSGPSLLFIVLPEAFTVLGVAPFWAFLFYACFALFAFHQQAIMLIVVLENIAESVPLRILSWIRRRELLAGLLCALAFLLGLPQVSNGGSYLVSLVETHSNMFLFLVVSLFASPVAVAFTKTNPLHLPIERLFICGWFAVASLVATVVLVYNCGVFQIPHLTKLSWPRWQYALGYLVALAPLVLSVSIGMAHAVYRANGETWWKKFRNSFRPLEGILAASDLPAKAIANGKPHSNGTVPVAPPLDPSVNRLRPKPLRREPADTSNRPPGWESLKHELEVAIKPPEANQPPTNV